MKKKTQFKVQLFEGANKTAELITLEAAKYNGLEEERQINLLHAFALTVKTMGRDESTSIEMVGENTFHVDTKINGNWKTVLIVEQIEVLEMVYEVEKDDLISDILTGARYPKN